MRKDEVEEKRRIWKANRVLDVLVNRTLFLIDGTKVEFERSSDGTPRMSGGTYYLSHNGEPAYCHVSLSLTELFDKTDWDKTDAVSK